MVMPMVVPVMMIMAMVVVMLAMFVMHVTLFPMGGVQELGLQGGDSLQVEAAAAEDQVQADIGPLRPVDRRQRVDPADRGLDPLQFDLIDQVGLVQDDLVGKGDLLDRFLRIDKAQGQVLGVDHGGHRIQSGPGLDIVVNEEGLGDRAGIGQARGLDDDGVETAFSLHQAGEHPDQVAAHRAADAAVVHLEDLFIGPDHQVVVDADFAEFVDDHRIAFAMLLGEDAVEQGGLAGAEIAGQDGDGSFRGHDAYLRGQAEKRNLQVSKSTTARPIATSTQPRIADS